MCMLNPTITSINPTTLFKVFFYDDPYFYSIFYTPYGYLIDENIDLHDYSKPSKSSNSYGYVSNNMFVYGYHGFSSMKHALQFIYYYLKFQGSYFSSATIVKFDIPENANVFQGIFSTSSHKLNTLASNILTNPTFIKSYKM